jgi:hypothetical protein
MRDTLLMVECSVVAWVRRGNLVRIALARRMRGVAGRHLSRCAVRARWSDSLFQHFDVQRQRLLRVHVLHLNPPALSSPDHRFRTLARREHMSKRHTVRGEALQASGNTTNGNANAWRACRCVLCDFSWCMKAERLTRVNGRFVCGAFVSITRER